MRVTMTIPQSDLCQVLKAVRCVIYIEPKGVRLEKAR